MFLGDFNMQPDSEEYERIVGPMSPYGGRVTNPEGFVDAWVEAGHPIDAGATAEVKGRPARLDYCFVSAALRDRIRSARVDSGAAGSDHQPVWGGDRPLKQPPFLTDSKYEHAVLTQKNPHNAPIRQNNAPRRQCTRCAFRG